MNPFVFCLLAAGWFLLALGNLMVAVEARRESASWAWVCFFVPFAKLVFVYQHWEVACKGFCIYMAGVAALVTAAHMDASVASSFARNLHMPAIPQMVGAPATPPPAPQVDIAQQVAECRERIERLEAEFSQNGALVTQRYAALMAEKKALKPGDEAGLTRFNADAAAYQELNAKQKSAQQQLAEARKQLDELFAERARQRENGGGKRVVMYGNASCPACQSARQYFAQKGIHYEEKDVERSRDAASEFQRMGGRVIPLIMVNNERVDGFSAQALDRIL